MNKVLILFAHPALQRSRINARLVEAVRNLEGVTFHDLYEAYPEFDVDVRREQALLAEHQIVVLQHPFYWYSTPPLIKQWEDLVLQHGWAYGSQGTALHGKQLLSVITTGARADAYRPEGFHRHTMRQLLAPLEQTFALCGMEYLPPFLVHGALGMRSKEIRRHAGDYRRTVEALRDGRLNLEAARRENHLNPRLDDLIRSGRGGD
jgi:glutathione-regulated potassium-efflux system ancillary protein KefG